MTKKKMPEAVAEPVKTEPAMPEVAAESKKPSVDWHEELVKAEANFDVAITAWCVANRLDNFEELGKAETALEKSQAAYATASLQLFYERCVALGGNPLINALKMLNYQILVVKHRKYETGLEYVEKDYKSKAISLPAFASFMQNSYHIAVGAKSDWMPKVAKFTQLMTAYAATELGYKPDDIKRLYDTYLIKEIANKIDLGETPTSKTQIQKALGEVVASIIGTDDGAGNKYNVLSHDAAYIRQLFGKKSPKALTMNTSSEREMYSYVAQVCHRILLDLNYTVAYKTKK